LIERNNATVFIALNRTNYVIVSIEYLDRFDRFISFDQGNIGQIPDV